MLNLMHVELNKLMKSKMLLIIFIGALVPIFLALIQFMPDRWISVFNLSHTYLNAFAVPIFVFVAGYLFTVEYRENTIYLQFTSPVSRTKILAAKCFVLLPVTLATYLLSFSLAVLTGLFFVDEAFSIPLMQEAILAYMKTALIQFLLIPTAITAAIIGRNYVLVAVKGIILFLMVTTITYTLEGFVIPWSLPYILAIKYGIRQNTFFPVREWNLPAATVALIALCLLCTAFNVMYYRKTELK